MTPSLLKTSCDVKFYAQIRAELVKTGDEVDLREGEHVLNFEFAEGGGFYVYIVKEGSR